MPRSPVSAPSGLSWGLTRSCTECAVSMRSVFRAQSGCWLSFQHLVSHRCSQVGLRLEVVLTALAVHWASLGGLQGPPARQALGSLFCRVSCLDTSTVQHRQRTPPVSSPVKCHWGTPLGDVVLNFSHSTAFLGLLPASPSPQHRDRKGP